MWNPTLRLKMSSGTAHFRAISTIWHCVICTLTSKFRIVQQTRHLTFFYSPGADDSHKPHEVVHIARSITSNNKLMCVGTNPSSRKIEMKSNNFFFTLCLTEVLSSIFYYNRLGVRVMSGKTTTRLSDNLLFTWELLAMNTSSCAAFEKQRDGRQWNSAHETACTLQSTSDDRYMLSLQITGLIRVWR